MYPSTDVVVFIIGDVDYKNSIADYRTDDAD